MVSKYKGSSSIAYHLCKFVDEGKQEHWDNAIEEAAWHAKTFKHNKKGEPRFYIELQRHGVEKQELINPHLIRLARELNLPLVCDNDAHFLTQKDWEAHDTLCCISMQKQKDEENRLKYSPELYVKSSEEMGSLFSDVPEAVANSALIAERCKVTFNLTKSYAPVVRVEGPKTIEPYNGGNLTHWFKNYCAKFELHPFDSHKEKEISTEELEND